MFEVSEHTDLVKTISCDVKLRFHFFVCNLCYLINVMECPLTLR